MSKTIEEHVKELGERETYYNLLDFEPANNKETKQYLYMIIAEDEEDALAKANSIIEGDLDTGTIPYLVKKTVTYEIVKKLKESD
ncbi:hypothetical protein phiOC_p328 [Ochrobactrum phage vB_OspM_OC]|nr:hypothetical protein phiOC_p328 [Ochrobactrum phage vB_OspM_OC]